MEIQIKQQDQNDQQQQNNEEQQNNEQRQSTGGLVPEEQLAGSDADADQGLDTSISADEQEDDDNPSDV